MGHVKREKMSWMFCGASSFNGNISSWNTPNVTVFHRMLDGVELVKEFRPNFQHLQR